MRTQSETSKLLKARENANDKVAFFFSFALIGKKNLERMAQLLRQNVDKMVELIPYHLIF